eukprot:8777952-Alexandrium_andersonii.AAC.1
MIAARAEEVARFADECARCASCAHWWAKRASSPYGPWINGRWARAQRGMRSRFLRAASGFREEARGLALRIHEFS